MNSVPQQCAIRCFIMAPSQIHYLRFILEAYEGIGVLTTIDPKLGMVQLSCSPGCEEEIDRILETESEKLQLRAVTGGLPEPGKKSDRNG